MRIRREHWISIGMLSVLTFGPYLPAILGFVRLIGHDLLNDFLPWKHLLVSELHAGRLPLWNPYVFSGYPHFANLQTAFFYPLDVLSLLVPLETFFPLTYAIHSGLAAIAMYIWLYRKTRSSIGAFTGALVWAWSGCVASNAMWGFLALTISHCYLPICLIIIDVLLETRRTIWVIALIVALSLQLLSGHPQPFLYTAYFLLAYVLWQVVHLYKEKRVGVKSGLALIALTALSPVVAGLVTAVSSFPLIEIAQFSAARSGGVTYEFATRDSLPFSGLLLMLSPFVFGHFLKDEFWITSIGYQEICGYLGLIPLFLSVVALRRRPERRFLSVMACLTLLAALGSNTPFFRLLYHLLPGFKWFRVPARLLMPWSFCIAALAGLGMSDLLQEPKKRFTLATKVLLVALTAVLIGLFLYPYFFGDALWTRSYQKEAEIHATGMGYGTPENLPIKVRDFLGDLSMERVDDFIAASRRSLIMGLASLIVVGLLQIRKYRLGLVLSAGFVLLLFDLGGFNVSLMNSQSVEDYDRTQYHASETIKFLQEDGSIFRILCADNVIGRMQRDKHPELYPERLTRFGIQSVRGYNPTILNYYGEYINVMNGKPPDTDLGGLLFLRRPDQMDRQMLNELNVKYLLTYETPPRGVRWRLTDSGLHVYENPQAYPRAYVSREDRLTEDPVTIEEYLPNKIRIAAFVSSPGVLVLADTWYPGWTAIVDGKEVAVERHHSIFRSVPVNGGDHEIVFRFRPRSFYLGAWVSIFALLALAVAAILALRRKSDPKPV